MLVSMIELHNILSVVSDFISVVEVHSIAGH